MKKSIILSVFVFLFFSVSASFGQTKWTNLVAQIPELSIPYQFDYDAYASDASTISKEDLTKHFKAKIGLADMWEGKVLGKITASDGSVAIIWAQEDRNTILYLISYFNKKGQEKELRHIIYHDGFNPRNSFTIKEEGSNYVFEEQYKKHTGETVGVIKVFSTNPATWSK